MGNLIHSAKESKHVLICGLSQAGKTTLFNLLIYGQPRDKPDLNLDMNKMAKEETTFGFNFEYAEKDQANCIGFWDIGGKDTIRAIWSSFYKNIRISGLIFVVNANDEDEKIDEARMELQKLMNEEELRNAVLYVVFNNILKENGENGEQKVMEEPGIRNNVFLSFIS